MFAGSHINATFAGGHVSVESQRCGVRPENLNAFSFRVFESGRVHGHIVSSRSEARGVQAILGSGVYTS